MQLDLCPAPDEDKQGSQRAKRAVRKRCRRYGLSKCTQNNLLVDDWYMETTNKASFEKYKGKRGEGGYFGGGLG